MGNELYVKLAKESGLWDAVGYPKEAVAFANLVAAHEREKHNSPSWETVDDAIAAEREACAKVCEGRADSYKYATDPWAHEHISEANTCAAAIRARGEQ